jgi:WD40 repeat protein
VQLWETTTGQLLKVPVGGLVFMGRIHAVAFSADGIRLASACHDKTVGLWGAMTGQLLKTFIATQVWLIQ